MRRIFLPIFFIFSCFIFVSFTLKGYVKEENKEVIWLYVDYPSKNINYYLEVSKDGNVLMVENLKSKNKTVREGSIKKMYAKDFFRETLNSEIIKYAKSVDLTKMLFYTGQTITLFVNYQGEVRKIITPLNRFGKTFMYAFNQVYENAVKLPETKKYIAFLYALPLEGKLYNDFKEKVPSNYELPFIETKEIMKNKFIFKAINNPGRLIPLETKEEENTVIKFIGEYNLYGLKSAFYFASTRGNFQCSVEEVVSK